MIFAQVPADVTTLESVLPQKYAAYVSAGFVILMIVGRAITAIKNEGGIMSIWRSIVMGSSTTTTAAPNNTVSVANPGGIPSSIPPPASSAAKISLMLLLIFGSLWVHGCSTDAVTTAVNADAVTIASVNAAMGAWSGYVAQGKATAAQIVTVSNAYAVYWNAQLFASNAAIMYVENPTTNAAGVESLAIGAALASETNIVAIINTLTK